jgi:hypothetical protein
MVYDNTALYTIEKGCPWYELQQMFGPPNVNWCEPTSCAVISEPANTWSNLGFIIVGLLLIFFKSKHVKSPLMKTLPFAILVMGIGSFVYHMTNNLGTQFLDFLGMYCFVNTIILINLVRMNHGFKTLWKSHYFWMIVVNCLLFPTFLFFGIGIQFIVVMNIVFILISEFLAFSKPQKAKYRNFFLTLFFFGIAQYMSLLDHTRTWCSPSNSFLHGHALWHILAAVGTFFAYLHYKQFDDDLSH